MSDFLRNLWVWSLASRARNWATHAVLAVVVALVVGAVVRFLSGPTISAWAAGAFAAGGFYVLKEIEEVLIAAMLDERVIDWVDGFGDALFPALAAGLLQLAL